MFPQKGVNLGLLVISSGGSAGLDFSPNGAPGTAFGGNALSDGARNQMGFAVPTPVPSPISNSNLLFMRETLNGASALGTCFARVLGVYV